jgi:hypothetical protein
MSKSILCHSVAAKARGKNTNNCGSPNGGRIFPKDPESEKGDHIVRISLYTMTNLNKEAKKERLDLP